MYDVPHVVDAGLVAGEAIGRVVILFIECQLFFGGASAIVAILLALCLEGVEGGNGDAGSATGRDGGLLCRGQCGRQAGDGGVAGKVEDIGGSIQCHIIAVAVDNEFVRFECCLDADDIINGIGNIHHHAVQFQRISAVNVLHDALLYVRAAEASVLVTVVKLLAADIDWIPFIDAVDVDITSLDDFAASLLHIVGVLVEVATQGAVGAIIIEVHVAEQQMGTTLDARIGFALEVVV